jgi:hypothetical protein
MNGMIWIGDIAGHWSTSRGYELRTNRRNPNS